MSDDWQIGYMTGFLVGIISVSGMWIVVEILKGIYRPGKWNEEDQSP